MKHCNHFIVVGERHFKATPKVPIVVGITRTLELARELGTRALLQVEAYTKVEIHRITDDWMVIASQAVAPTSVQWSDSRDY